MRRSIASMAASSAVSTAALLAVLSWSGNAVSQTGPASSEISASYQNSAVTVSVIAALRLIKDPEDVAEDLEEEALDLEEDLADELADDLEDQEGLAEDLAEDIAKDLEDALEDEVGLEDDADLEDDDLDEPEDLESGEDDNSGLGSEDDDDELDQDEDNSGSSNDDNDDDGDDGDDDDREDRSGSSNDDDDDDDDDSEDRSGSSNDDDDDKDRSGSSNDDDDAKGGSRNDSDEDDEGIYEEYVDDDGFAAVDDEFLMLVPRSDVEDGSLGDMDFEVQHELDALDMVMIRVRVGDEDDLAAVMDDRDAEDDESIADLNHFYQPEAEDEAKGDFGTSGANPAPLAAALGLGKTAVLRGRIGLIDSSIDLEHRALSGASIVVRDFADRGIPPAPDHGTMIASIFVGSDPGVFDGIAPTYELLAANAFFNRPDGKVLASVESLILAIDWLVGEDMPVINMSLSGPPNRLLERAIARATEAGTIIVAAVGNSGPAAAPLYPAAYDDVVGVTAVDRQMHAFHSAGRGNHVDFAAPGVDVRAAIGHGDYLAQSGTSLAAPFVTVVLTEMNGRDGRSWAEILAVLRGNARDLGEGGFDPVFGYGLIRAVTAEAPEADAYQSKP